MRKAIKTFFKSEISIGVLLLLATIAALLISNSQNFEIYQNFFAANLPLSIDFIGLQKDLTIRDWINDALMALFFLLIGLELKKEILIGELSSKSKIILPTLAALGGIIFPILIFIFCNFGNQENLRGFAIPCATDIAFAYGMIALFGKKIPNSLKVFFVALAVLDDLIAILIIAFFYSGNINFTYLLLSCALLLALFFLNQKNCAKISFYLILGIFLWLAVLKSGLHATLSGVLLALFIPLQIKNESLLSKLAHQIAPLVNFLILPLFAFANAAVRIENFSTEIFFQPLVLGIALGLFFGKQTGIMLFSFFAIKLKITNLPRSANWFEFYAVSCLAGIGFTMSLFIAALAFAQNNIAFDAAKTGILTGSFFSLLWGIIIIFFCKRSTPAKLV